MKRGHLWTGEEEERLQEMFLQHARPEKIAKELGRTVFSVKLKAHPWDNDCPIPQPEAARLVERLKARE